MSREKIATVEMEESVSKQQEDEVIRRLDDGNTFPAFEVESEGDGKFSVYENR